MKAANSRKNKPNDIVVATIILQQNRIRDVYYVLSTTGKLKLLLLQTVSQKSSHLLTVCNFVKS